MSPKHARRYWVSFTLSEEEHTKAVHVAGRHKLTLNQFTALLLERAVAEVTWAEEVTADTPAEERNRGPVLPTLPPPEDE